MDEKKCAKCGKDLCDECTCENDATVCKGCCEDADSAKEVKEGEEGENCEHCADKTCCAAGEKDK